MAKDAGQEDQGQQPKKVKISFEEYQRISTLIVGVMKEFEAQGFENIQQSELINKMVHKLEVEQ